MFMESDERKEVFFTDPLLSELYVMNIGYEKCLPGHSFGPQIREYYVLHYILRGKGQFRSRETVYHLKPGNFFLIEPNDLYAVYEADEQEPWEYVWIGFHGSRAGQVLQELGFHTHVQVGMLHNREEAESYIHALITDHWLRHHSMLRVQGDFLHMLSYFRIDPPTRHIDYTPGSRRHYVDLFIVHVRTSYWNPELTVSSIAAQIGIHPTYLTHMIQSELQQTSLQYLTHYRMLRGKFLLENTDYTVEKVAHAVGYANPLSFARAFKRLFGVPPGSYGKSSKQHS
ncbi:AraC family transcriptional regulator [Paenibacillus sp. SGZ-1009]|uniref:AraC family transcriptional regulator n=1 Tax=Paenibacillus campi TaxID=3106031 RepID=UPI002AFF89A9|nr:AraC family ligand binding domain-containing protein [Paenibacillus sp. SGZ-1009]